MQIEESNLFGPVNPKDIIEFEEANEVLLPDDYKDFLLQHNGGRPVPNQLPEVNTDVNWLYSMVEEPGWASLFQAIDVYESRIPSRYMPIGTNSSGNIYIMSLFAENKGLIALWWHEEEAKENGSEYFDNLTALANSFTEFLASLEEHIS